MSGFKKLYDKAVAMDRVNVDTDQIIPKQFLKRIEKTGFGRFAFFDWRYLKNGEPNPEFELNQPENQGASILIANKNFGCGSSREHAPWALQDFGFSVVIAPSFADIFYQNCLKNGMLPIQLQTDEVEYLLKAAQSQPYFLDINLEDETVEDDQGFSTSFSIHPYWKKMLINGWDEIEITLQYSDKIAEYENKTISK
ncbi:3-isopropylmalate dehydratase small subunit [Niallia circulans]|jgi:3-isopropylmalate/(R)-2-methylmalate dehydratase small subunit|uniref:3-isopropylmalate dehydratase small subunit n=1 Tax=Niallia circulans TaxID=1397 RepID=A0A0J1IEV9_NIACI|nr:3-isopropylmalate dehydratase small subunit [Niallia circulans]KLV24478.1 isopropylmalate isomerase [Niallia circulans]MCM2980539.1 3-isopropylmalate dehydratase small subunit [Niallia circulans]MDR4317369.1 3-isopropylmalate dehydratase small subunit [Niallia circulans]MED3838861.1 3-isopropylmalate dehydratase small subunit [Niallia circulans]MED4245258.1 3-isopropylmalate dehydratase small subunit [Niallia circulans]